MAKKISSGFAKFSRKFWVDGNLFNENGHNTLAVYSYLILHANYSEGKYKGREVKIGQVVASMSVIAERISLTPKQVRTALSHLEKHRYITVTPYSSYSVIQVLEEPGPAKPTNQTKVQTEEDWEEFKKTHQ